MSVPMSSLSIFINSAAITIVFLIVAAPVARFLGLIDKPSTRKKHVGDVPLTGGLAILATVVLISFVTHSPPLPVLLALGFICLVGVIDDMVDVPARMKLLCQCALATYLFLHGDVAVLTLGTLPEGGELRLGVFALPFTVVAIVGLINAINMIDGIDGLASSQVFIAIVSLALMPLIYDGSSLGGLADQMLVLAAALLIFFAFNISPSKKYKAFLGDSGSMTLGLYLSCFLISASQPHLGPAALPASLIPWLIAIPILDTITLIWRRARQRRSPFTPGRDHIHHILIDKGFSPIMSLMIISALGVVFFCAGLLFSMLHPLLSGVAFLIISIIYGYLVGKASNAQTPV